MIVPLLDLAHTMIGYDFYLAFRPLPVNRDIAKTETAASDPVLNLTELTISPTSQLTFGLLLHEK